MDHDYENYETESRSVEEFVGTLTAGQPPTKVRSILSLSNPSSWSNLSIDGPLWSSDGTRLLYSQYDDQGLDTRTARVVTLAGGAVTPVADPQFRDWQPCPTGECASWDAARRLHDPRHLGSRPAGGHSRTRCRLRAGGR